MKPTVQDKLNASARPDRTTLRVHAIDEQLREAIKETREHRDLKVRQIIRAAVTDELPGMGDIDRLSRIVDAMWEGWVFSHMNICSKLRKIFTTCGHCLLNISRYRDPDRYSISINVTGPHFGDEPRIFNRR